MTNRDEFQLVTWGRDSHMTLWPIGGQIKAMCGQEPDEKILADNAQVAETLKKATDIRETVEAIEHLDVASNSPSNNETEDIMLKSASFSELETGSGIGKFFTYVTKTIANLTTYSRKQENYDGTIIFEIDFMENSSPINLKLDFFTIFLVFSFILIYWLYSEA
jgi:hypothetical protein